MNEPGIYLLKVSAGVALFVLPYMLFLRNDNNLRLKRIYLLLALFSSWLIPVWHPHILPPAILDTPRFLLDINPAGPQPVIHSAGGPVGISISDLAWYVYLAGILILLFRNAWFILKNVNMRKSEMTEDYHLYSGGDHAFAFFRNIYIPEHFECREDIDTILIHERAHIRQGHYLDLLCLEFTVLLTWFNPFTWLISRMMRENHEHLADREVLSRGVDPAHYRARILNQAFGTRIFSLGHPFNHSFTKKRFAMMKNMRFSKSGLVKVIFLLPAILITLSFISTGRQKESAVTGKVTLSDSGLPAVGAAVVVSNTTTGTVTGDGGVFSLGVSGRVRLVISYVGYTSTVREVSPGDRVTVTLDPARTEVDINNLPPEEKSPALNKEGEQTVSGNDIYVVVEQMPEFPGGRKALRDYVYSHLTYPGRAGQKNPEGTVDVGFTVTKDGQVKDIRVMHSSNPVLDKPAMEVFKNMPAWKPGYQHGHPVDVNLTVPVRFEPGRGSSLDK